MSLNGTEPEEKVSGVFDVDEFVIRTAILSQ